MTLPWIDPQRIVWYREDAARFLDSLATLMEPHNVRTSGGQQTTAYQDTDTVPCILYPRRQLPQAGDTGGRVATTILYDLYTEITVDIPDSWRVRINGIVYENRGKETGTNEPYNHYVLERTP